MKFLIGTKKKMTQVRLDDGRVVSATIIQVDPCVVTAVKSAERDGYVAVQVGTGKRRRVSKALAGHLKGAGPFRYIRELRPRDTETLPADVAVGSTLDLQQFTAGDMVTVVGTSKGRGFQGVVKRHHFHGSPKSHGHKDQLRMPGSIGAGGLQRVLKGTRMGGRMGSERVTVKNLTVVAVDTNTGELVVSGAIPGAPRGLVVVRGV